MQENLIQIDFSQIESLDPCIQGGYKIIFNQEIPFMIKFPDQEDQSIIEIIRVRIMILGNGKDLQQLTLELSSENDLFFYYNRKLTFIRILLNHFLLMHQPFIFKQNDNFSCIFTQSIKTIFKLSKLIKNSTQISLGIQKYALKHSGDVYWKNSSNKCNICGRFAPVLYIQQNARAQVSIVQTLEYKDLTLITFEMIAGDEEIIKQHIYYKHGAVKSKFQIQFNKCRFIFFYIN